LYSQQHGTSFLADATSFKATEKIPLLDFVGQLKPDQFVLVNWSAVFGKQESLMDCTDGKASCFALHLNGPAKFLATKIEQWRLQQSKAKSGKLVVIQKNEKSTGHVSQSSVSDNPSDVQIVKQRGNGKIVREVQVVREQIDNVDNEIQRLRDQLVEEPRHGERQEDNEEALRRQRELEQRLAAAELEKERLRKEEERLKREREDRIVKTKAAILNALPGWVKTLNEIAGHIYSGPWASQQKTGVKTRIKNEIVPMLTARMNSGDPDKIESGLIEALRDFLGDASNKLQGEKKAGGKTDQLLIDVSKYVDFDR
ncbi:MAG: hypothetical protein AAF320_06370, partial [Myxococcota bacterium]